MKFFKNDDGNIRNLVENKKLPIIILDQHWYALFRENEKTKQISDLETKLKQLIQEQGELNNKVKEFSLLKKDLMNKIIANMNENYDNNSAKLMEINQKYILEINEKLEKYEKRLEELPLIIKKMNEDLLVLSVEFFYKRMKKVNKELQQMQQWIDETREKLKLKIIEKQEKEEQNKNVYNYMHDLLGHEFLNLFDNNLDI